MEAQQHDQPSSTTSSLFLHTSNAQPNQTVHWLPCNIQYDGPANICQYFNPTPDNPAGVTAPRISRPSYLPPTAHASHEQQIPL